MRGLALNGMNIYNSASKVTLLCTQLDLRCLDIDHGFLVAIFVMNLGSDQ